MTLINYEKKDKVVTITLNRPDRLNAMSQEMIAELGDAWREYAGDPEARVAILTGAGRVFCAGFDVKDLAQPSYMKQVDFREDDTIGGMSRVEKPIITAINGLALGGGCTLAMASDIRIAAKTAALGMPEITLGLYAGVDVLIAQGVPFCTAMELALTGEPMPAQRAYEVGLVNKVVPDEEVIPTALKIAERIAEMSPLALKMNKQIGVRAIELMQEALDLRQTVFSKLANSEDFQEAAKAFMEKRKPIFKGR